MKYLRYIFSVAMVCLCHAVSATQVQSEIPVIRLQYSALDKDTFSAASFVFISNADTTAMPALIRHRGASSTKYQKKSYAVKLLDEAGEKKDASFMGMRSDNYWILDAMAVEKGRMRNRVAMDLWLDFSAKPSYVSAEPDMCNGARGKFVEVYVNDAYEGLYCLMERVDRKQLKLKKAKNTTINGVLYKSATWDGSLFGPLTPYDNHSATWMRYEYEYPDVEDNLITWAPLYDVMDFVNTASAADFAAQVSSRVDVPVWMDYFLFTNLLSARDNCGKNLYLSFYNINQNSPLLVTPWDMDHSFGRMYNADKEDPQAVCKWSNALYNRLASDLPDYYTQLLERYAELRHTFFSLEALMQRFSDYFALFNATHVAERETERWSGVNDVSLDFSAEETYIASWLEQRLAYTDSLFHYTSEESAVEQLSVPCSASKQFRDGRFIIIRDTKAYTLTGQEIQP